VRRYIHRPALVLATSVLALFLVAWFVLAPVAKPNRLTLERYEEVAFGMTRDQVESVLGGPPGNYKTRTMASGLDRSSIRFIEPTATLRWQDDRHAVEVIFDARGEVLTYRHSKGVPGYRN
jgi:hypothetical protein